MHSKQHEKVHQLFFGGYLHLQFELSASITGSTSEKSSKESLEAHRETHTKQKAVKPAWAEGGVSIRIHGWVGAVQRNQTVTQRPVLQLAE